MAKRVKGQHGGKRAGAGRKPVDPSSHFTRISITLPPDVAVKLDDLTKRHKWTKSQAVVEAIRRL